MSGDFVDYISMNLNDANLTPHDGKFQRVEPGTYDFEIDKAVFDQSRKGNRTLRVSAKIIGPEGSSMIGRSMTCTYVIDESDFARRRMKQLIQGTGAQTDAQGGFSREALVGLMFTADVVTDSFDDLNPKTGLMETREVVKWNGERPIGGGEVVQTAPPPPQQKAATAPAAGNGGRRPTPPTNGRAQPR